MCYRFLRSRSRTIVRARSRSRIDALTRSALFFFAYFLCLESHKLRRAQLLGEKQDSGQLAHLNISVCVPSTLTDYSDGHLSATIVSIKAQSYRPSEVIVALSDVDFERYPTIRDDLRRQLEPIPTILIFSDSKRTPGENRNAAKKAATGNIISFFDADDTMHVNRIEAIHQAFQYNPKLKLLLHGYARPNTRMYLVRTRRVEHGMVCKIHENTAQIGQAWLSSENLQFQLTHGHVTVRHDVAKMFNFGMSMTGEDTTFVRSILDSLCVDLNSEQSLILDFPFTKYIPRAKRDSKKRWGEHKPAY